MDLNVKEITDALRLFFRPGDVFEVRIIGAITRAYAREHIESGYFEYDAIDRVPEAMNHIRVAKGVYVTVNPVRKSLLNRAVNRIHTPGRGPTTSDAEILERRWFLVDCDAKRESGIPSSDPEHEMARKKAIEIRDGLASMGFPAPIEIDSGNGAQLMYRVDLPADDGGLVRNALQGLAATSSDAVDLDVTVFNPARIWRLPGTMNCKGDSTEERPHRFDRILNVPATLEIVPKDLLARLAPPEEDEPPAAPSVPAEPVYYTSSEPFDLESWISKYCAGMAIFGPTRWKDGLKWVFDVCPFNPAHDNKSAVITQQANGAIGFKCHHNGCAGNDWHKLRELLEFPMETSKRGSSSPAFPSCPEVDLTQILAKISRINGVPDAAPKIDDSFMIDEELLDVPGLIHDIMHFTLDTAPYPNRVLAFAGALAFMSFACGRKYTDKRGVYTNIYIIALASSGTGKDHPRKVNFNLAHQMEVLPQIGEAFASGAGFEDSMNQNLRMLFQLDEADWIFNVLKSSVDASAAESINEKLLKMYSSSSSFYPMRKKARNPKENSTESLVIIKPSCTLFGTAVPKYFYEAISRRSLENGLIARCMIIEAGRRGTRGNPRDAVPDGDLIEKMKAVASMPKIQWNNPKPIMLNESPSAEVAIRAALDTFDSRYEEAFSRGDESSMSMWARAGEKMLKLIIIYSVSKNPENPLIIKDAVDWAFRFVSVVTIRTIQMTEDYCYESPDHADMNRIARFIAKQKIVTTSQILRATHILSRRLTDLLRTMLDAEVIELVQVPTKTKPKSFYQLKMPD